MTFVFQCPRGHRLGGQIRDAGRPTYCPACHQLIEVPSPPAGSQASAAPLVAAAPISVAAPAAASPTAIAIKPVADAAPELFHIPCPNGHELATPPDLINRPARCPECGVEFVLRKESSVEFQMQEERRREAHDRRMGKIWLRVAICVMIAVVMGISLMVALSQ